MPVILTIIILSGFLQASSDPAAKKLMDKVSNHYQGLKSLEIQFSYEMKVGDKSDGMQKGILISRGEMYKLSLPEMDLYCDGTDQYAHLKKNKEIQISRKDDSDTRYHPKSLAAIHKSGEYAFRIEDKIIDQNKKWTVVELKPNDKNAGVFKIKLFINETSKWIEKVQWFEKSGKTTLVTFHKTLTDKNYADGFFRPDFKSLKDVHLEDLRDE